MIGRHCSRCSNPYIDNPDCACKCHDAERAELLAVFAAQASRPPKPSHKKRDTRWR